MAKKTTNTIKATACPITRGEFERSAPKIEVVINGQTYHLNGRAFATGSLGYNLSDKGTVKVGDKVCKVQIGLNITLIGSKDLPAAVKEAA